MSPAHASLLPAFLVVKPFDFIRTFFLLLKSGLLDGDT